MPTTRSATRAQTQATQPSAEVPIAAPKNAKAGQTTKRKAANASADVSGKKKRVATSKTDVLEPAQATRRPTVPPPDSFIPVLLPAKLTFSLEEAKAHLSRADKRFEDVFTRLPCKPFEKLERVEPFRTLTTSILGQQISWMAARSITHKFIRLYFPHLPEKPDDNFWAKAPDAPFPTPHQVAATDVPSLRTAGLSARKAEYVQDLAARFADGRLTSQKLFDADDEELHEMLTAVRGIGRWTVDMFAIFSLRRPDIMPFGDLGVQRGVLRWFLSLHHPTYRIEISPQKLPKDPNKDQAKPKKPKSSQAADDADALPVLSAATTWTPSPSLVPQRKQRPVHWKRPRRTHRSCSPYPP
ncbi:hypothetical protein EWM64_g10350 [Hericium alpestre]|uniref:HhH-GPD domain-containing protein n=1 Tax=Hericium alpestre TaxID=135208 RepID=A0A4Y9ZII1_9AGAM|nr:hypothetical protein EWM64_g10350 [Hericium alpestre]